MSEKIILIFTEKSDVSTLKVVEYLNYFDAKYQVILNDNYLSKNVSITIDKNSDNNIYNNEQIKSIWYRRGMLELKIQFNNAENNNQYTNALWKDKITQYIHLNQYIKSKSFQIGIKILGNMTKYSVNKLISLEYAKSCGLNIPNTIITRSKKELIKFKNSNSRIITKAIQEQFITYISGDNTYLNFSEEISDSFIDELPDFFEYSLFQEYIDKKFEIRVFYLDGDFYSMAIFSQNDTKTKIDFRKYNRLKPNRMIPYILPSYVKNNICLLMQKLELNTGSIDIIKTINNEFYFLEVNPVGMYPMVSHPCNYHLEKKIAKYLINE